jgi:hypothetical protein
LRSGGVDDAKHLREKAGRCLRLAQYIGDTLTVERLTALAAEYVQQANALSPKGETETE